MRSVPAITFDYRPSRWIGAAAASAVLLAVAAPWLSGSPPPLRAVLSLAALLIGARALHRHWHPAFRRIVHQPSGWMLVDASNAESPAVLESHAQVGALLALGFRHGPRARFRALLLPDNLDADTRRRLRLLLARGEIAHAA
jgi:hypothetical protein